MRPKRQANKQQEIEAPDEDTDDADDATPHIWGTLHNQTDANQALHKCLNIKSNYNKTEFVKSVSIGLLWRGQHCNLLTHFTPEHTRATFGISDNQSRWWGDFKWPIQRPEKRQWQENWQWWKSTLTLTLLLSYCIMQRLIFFEEKIKFWKHRVFDRFPLVRVVTNMPFTHNVTKRSGEVELFFL